MCGSATTITLPPSPPSPPEGPPRGTPSSRRNAADPLPPSPALSWMTASSMNCTASVYHVWVRAVVGAAMRRALGVWIGCGIVADVLFGPTGIPTRDQTGLALHDPAAGGVLAATWLLLIVPID